MPDLGGRGGVVGVAGVPAGLLKRDGLVEAQGLGRKALPGIKPSLRSSKTNND